MIVSVYALHMFVCVMFAYVMCASMYHMYCVPKYVYCIYNVFYVFYLVCIFYIIHVVLCTVIGCEVVFCMCVCISL